MFDVRRCPPPCALSALDGKKYEKLPNEPIFPGNTAARPAGASAKEDASGSAFFILPSAFIIGLLTLLLTRWRRFSIVRTNRRFDGQAPTLRLRQRLNTNN